MDSSFDGPCDARIRLELEKCAVQRYPQLDRNPNPKYTTVHHYTSPNPPDLNTTPRSRSPFSLFERSPRPPGHESILILDLEHGLAKVLALQHANEALGGIIDALGDA